MRSIVELLEQTSIWRGQDGRVYYVGELDDEYLGNIIAYLNRHAVRLLGHRRWYDERQGHSTAVERVLGLESLDATTWLHDRPLYRALLAEQRRRGTIDGEVVHLGERVERLVTERIRELEAVPDVTRAVDHVVIENDRTLTDLSQLLQRYREAIRRLGEL